MCSLLNLALIMLAIAFVRSYYGEFEEFDYLECMKILAVHLPHSM